jgi:hypothetical protein
MYMHARATNLSVILPARDFNNTIFHLLSLVGALVPLLWDTLVSPVWASARIAVAVAAAATAWITAAASDDVGCTSGPDPPCAVCGGTGDARGGTDSDIGHGNIGTAAGAVVCTSCESAQANTDAGGGGETVARRALPPQAAAGGTQGARLAVVAAPHWLVRARLAVGDEKWRVLPTALAGTAIAIVVAAAAAERADWVAWTGVPMAALVLVVSDAAAGKKLAHDE